MSKPKAYARRFGDIPEEQRQLNVHPDEFNTKVYVDEAGLPINRADLDKYEYTNTLWRPSLKSTGQTLLSEIVIEEERPQKETRRVKPTRRGVDMWAGANYSPRFNAASAKLGMNPLNWPKHVPKSYWSSDTHKAVVSGSNDAAAIVATPFALYGLGAAYSVPEIAGAMNLYGAYEGIGRLTSDEGISKTYNRFKSGDYTGGAKSLGGDVLDVAMSLPFLNRVRQATYNIAKPSVLGYKLSRMPLGEVETSTLTSQNRFRVGDLEINDPNLNYRLGKKGLINDFFESGIVRTQENPERVIEKAANPLRRFLLTKSFDNPMFKLGGLWYDPELVTREILVPSKPEMLVTRLPLRFATKTSGPAKVDMGGRRIPFSPDLLNPLNTSAFVWQDGYGFRRVSQETTPIIKLEF